MRILLLSANTGEGHNSTARAIMDVLHQMQVRCDMHDTLAFLSPRFSKFICNWHARLYKYGPKLVDAGYRVMERSDTSPEEITLLYELLSLGAGRLWQIVTDGGYDAVICVHTFSSMMMTEVRRVWGVEIPCFFVATDYTCSPTVEQGEMDGYFIPAQALAEEFVIAGLPRGKLIPSGIPVHRSFCQEGDRWLARQKLSLPKNGLMVLLMCGSMGCGPMQKIAAELTAQLPGDAYVVAVCGNNGRLKQTLNGIRSPRLQVLGYTNNIPDYMDAADIIVTKPGGLSATEAANKHLPMVLINAVGGCEARNFEYFLRRGYAQGSSDAQEVVRWTVELARDSGHRQSMCDALRREFNTDSASAIAHHVVKAAAAYRGIPQVQSIPTWRNGHPLKGKEGCAMENQQKVTITNLARSFAGEAQARTRYTVYAQIARKEGKEWIARVFEETADNEAVHGEEFLEMLQKLGACAPNIDLAAGYPFELGNTEQNLAFAAAGEKHEHDAAYPEFAEIARREGFDDAARLWLQIARIEGVHHNTFASLHAQLNSGTLTEKETPIRWRCLNCGYTYEGIRACDPCPVCGKEAGWQEGELDRKEMITKK